MCEAELSSHDEHICSFCEQDLERTYFESVQEPTPMDQLFWGRQQVASTYAHYYFKKNAGTQKLLFQLKYGKNAQLGVALGESIGLAIQNNSKYAFDVLVPVPLHKKRQFQRGYNQSEQVALGIQNKTLIPVDTRLIKRKANNKSQTGKSRFERWDNVESIFNVDPKKLRSIQHLAIVDDVITTGSTVESLINEIRRVNKDIKISVVTLAIA